eukprot:16437745-Heterocapsa_arctica.AAC.1
MAPALGGHGSAEALQIYLEMRYLEKYLMIVHISLSVFSLDPKATPVVIRFAKADAAESGGVAGAM